MRILFLSLVLALPFATVASAQTGFDERHVGIGANIDVGSVGREDTLLPRVDRVFLRWQVTSGVALEPSLGIVGARSSFDNDVFGTSTDVAAGLGGRFRVAHTNDVAALVLARTSLRSSAGSNDGDGDDVFDTSSSASWRASAGVGIEYAPKRHWALGADYTVQLVAMDTSRLGDMSPGTSWRLGPSSFGQLGAHATLYF